MQDDSSTKAELVVLLSHIFIIVLVIVSTTILAIAGRIDPQTLAVILSTALGFSGAKASATSVRRRSGNGS